MKCKSCLLTEVLYEICFEGEENQRMLPILIHHVRLQQGQISQRGNILLVREEAVIDLVDFCQEHMQADLIFYRTEGTDWRSLGSIHSVLESQWIDDLIANERITPYFQPIVDPEQNIYGHEILSRFEDEHGMSIPPNETFSTAKRRNRLFALDKLCRITAVKHSVPLLQQKVFINFLPTSIYSPEHCLQTTLEMSRKLGAHPSNFVFEVVETEHVEDIDHLKNILRYYRAHGFEYALDDVGEGYSTIELLRELKPAYMKLDMKYVQGISRDREKQHMAQRMLQAAIEIGSIPLAEGIEDIRDFDYVKELGFRLFQGYLFGKPTPLAIGL